MIDLIVFNVGTNRYAMNIENVQRIIQSVELTKMPNAHEYIEGVMSYEKRVLKVLNFRKLITLQTYENELKTLFTKLKMSHIDWMSALRTSLEEGLVFTQTLNPHACDLGKWMDSFTAYDDSVIAILSELMEYHKLLHVTGAEALEVARVDKESALKMLNVDITNIFDHTIRALDTFTKELDLVANSLQKLIIYDNKGSMFAIKVDNIQDIAHVQESEFINSDGEAFVNDFLELDGILDLKGVLINVIKTVKLPH